MAHQDPAAPFPAAATFPVDYEVFAGRESNRVLKGSGTLEVSGEPPSYRFTGRKRGSLSRETVESVFGADQILNVTALGRRVTFTPAAVPGERPFVFFARDAASAQAIARILPRSVDADFVAARDFGERLRQLPGSRNPLVSVTGIIIALNVAVFLVMAGFLGAGWLETSDMTPYVRYGANNAAATTDGQWWRLLTSMFMHYGILHLSLNMWALLQSGRLVERLQGRVIYAFTYLASGLGGGFLSMAWHGTKVWSVGASGAIFGVYGALLGYMLREKQALPRSVFQPILRSTLAFAGYNLLYGLSNPAIDNGAHVGGLLTGFVMGWLTAPPLDEQSRTRLLGSRVRIAVATTLALVVVGVATAPRYNYSVSDEIAWSDAVKTFNSQAQGLEQQLDAAVGQWMASRDSGHGLRRLVSDKLVPFYSAFARDIDALRLSKGRLTDRRRTAFSEFARLRLESLNSLLRALDDNGRNQGSAVESDLAAYADLDRRASAVVQAYLNSERGKS